jgi:tRNA pseudouridine38-40 synthase
VPRYKLTLAYDGTDYCGWQRQEPPAPESDGRPADQRPSRPAASKVAGPAPADEDGRARIALRTVQHTLEEAVAGVLRERVSVLGASRTDAGVHARGQVAAFTCGGEEGGTGWPASRGCEGLLRAINGRLPEDVLVVGCEEARGDFDPIGGAVEKEYSYTLHVSPPPPTGLGLRPLWDRRYVHHVWSALDVEAMRRSAGTLVGTHDFAGFAAAGHGRASTVRTIFACEVVEGPGPLGAGEPDRRVRIVIRGDGFLWNMVRIVAGTLVEAGRGRILPGDMPAILASRDRRRAGPTLPPTGLCLEWVRYA